MKKLIAVAVIAAAVFALSPVTCHGYEAGYDYYPRSGYEYYLGSYVRGGQTAEQLTQNQVMVENAIAVAGN